MRSSSPNIAAGSLQVDDPVVIMYHPFLPEGELVSRAGEIGTLANVSDIEVKGNKVSLSLSLSLSLKKIFLFNFYVRGLEMFCCVKKFES